MISAWAGGICGFLCPLINKTNDKSDSSRSQSIEMEEKRNLINDDEDEFYIKGINENNGVDNNNQNIINSGNEDINISSEQTEEISANPAEIKREVKFTNNLRFRLDENDLKEIKDYLLDPNNKEVVHLANGQSFELEVSYIRLGGIYGNMYLEDRNIQVRLTSSIEIDYIAARKLY